MSVPPNYYGQYDYSKAPNPYGMQQQYAMPQGYGAPQAYGQQSAPTQRDLAPSNSLWVGDLEPWMDENYVMSMFIGTGEVSGVKLIRDKTTSLPAGYGFVYFKTVQGAENSMKNLNGQPIPQLPNKRYKLNWASHGTSGSKPAPTAQPAYAPRPQVPQIPQPTHTAPSGGNDDQKALFVGDLAADVTDQVLLQTFTYYYPSVYNARVVIDPRTGQSKGYGFVYFGDDKEKTRALTEMQGFYVSYKPIKLNYATKKSQQPGMFQGAPNPYPQPQYPYPYPHYPQQQYPGYPYPYPQQQPYPTQQPTYQRRPRPTVDPAQDPTNTTLFVGGLDLSISSEQLKGKFEPFGEVAGIRIPVGKGCAFVEYKNRSDAEAALKGLGNTIQVGNSTARVFWGRPQKPQPNQPSTPTRSSSGSGQTSESEEGQTHPESQHSESETYNPAETYDYQEYYNREEPQSPPQEENGTSETTKKRELEPEETSESSEEPSTKRAKTNDEPEEGESKTETLNKTEPETKTEETKAEETKAEEEKNKENE